MIKFTVTILITFISVSLLIFSQKYWSFDKKMSCLGLVFIIVYMAYAYKTKGIYDFDD